MKVFIIAVAMILVFTGFFLFALSNDMYVEKQVELKGVANDAADAAALYYDTEAYSAGTKVFNKDEGNAAVDHIIGSALRKEPHGVYVYYFDGTGSLTVYQDGILVDSKVITFPYQFEEDLTNYKATIVGAMVVVTIDCDTVDFYVPWIPDPPLIRTSGYEYINY